MPAIWKVACGECRLFAVEKPLTTGHWGFFGASFDMRATASHLERMKPNPFPPSISRLRTSGQEAAKKKGVPHQTHCYRGSINGSMKSWTIEIKIDSSRRRCFIILHKKPPSISVWQVFSGPTSPSFCFLRTSCMFDQQEQAREPIPKHSIRHHESRVCL